jgi:23S rRNA (uridine2552-2'-O)-methyltransferase
MAYERKDAYYKRAKAEGYRSRAAFKLLELNRRYRLMRSGDRVVDLGAWPGGWLQVAAECVGQRGRVVGIDLVALEPLPQPWVTLFCADLRDENVREKISAAIGGKADLVLSDMAPKLSGIRDRDEAQALELANLALDVARTLLRPGGRLLVKLFDGPETKGLVGRLRNAFASVSTIRPEATRKGSSELYGLASGYRPASD